MLVMTDHCPRDYFRRLAWTLPWPPPGSTARPPSTTCGHTHATRLARDGVSIEILRERLGHASLITTQKYISASATIDTTAGPAMARLMARRPAPAAATRCADHARVTDHRQRRQTRP